MSALRRLSAACSTLVVASGLVLAPFLSGPASAAVATPTVSSTSPASPNPSTTPLVKGTAQSGSTVSLYSDSACSSSALGSGPAASFAGSGITATVPANATTTIYAKARITGQSSSSCSTTSVSYRSDSTAPALVTFSGTSPASPWSSTTPAVRGTAEAGSTVRIYPTSGCTGSPSATGTAAAFASPGLTVTVAAGSTTTFKATATDAAGNVSACSTSTQTYVNDSTAPGQVTLTSITPTSPNPSTTPVVKGTAEAGSTVRIYPTSGCTGTPSATGTAAAFASPGLTVTVAGGSTTTFKATATDAAGNVSACSTSSLTYVQDSSAPALVTVSSVTPTSPNPSTAPVVKGTAEAGSTVRLYPTAGCTGTPTATGTAAAFASPGLTATVVVGTTTTFRATATDAAGNTSACSASSVTYTSDLLDGGFEASTGSPANSPSWTEADSLAGSPLCLTTTCDGTGVTAPRTGNAWAWFGGFPGPESAGQTASLSQTLTIPVGTLSLTYYFKNATVTAPFDAQLLVRVDGTLVKTTFEAPVADPAYTLQYADLSAFANGASHTISFEYTNGAEGLNSMVVDDVHLSAAPAVVTGTPTVTATSPGSPSTSTTPVVTGTAEAGTTVTLYTNSTCTSAALGAGSAADFAGAGIAVTVPSHTTTTIFARAAKAAQRDSACSSTSVSYTQKDPASAPDTALTKTRKKILTVKRKAKVSFTFSSPVAGATFECSIDGGAFQACTSGAKLKLKLGKHTFAVRAVAAGMMDTTPATSHLKIKRRP